MFRLLLLLVIALAVTGWALDDIGVERVEIWRNCLTPVDSDRPGVCRNATPAGPADKVFIGNASFVPGARADIEAGFPTHPQAYRAGWGYLLLTNALPNQTSLSTEGGQGTITLYAYAIDREGAYVELGSKTVTLDNDNLPIMERRYVGTRLHSEHCEGLPDVLGLPPNSGHTENRIVPHREKPLVLPLLLWIGRRGELVKSVRDDQTAA